jgi:hypothetical protein
MRWRRHETIEKSRRLLGFALDGQGVHAREWSGFRGKADIGVVSNALRCVEAANALIRVHKASTQNQNLRSKTSKISMSQRKNCKSCHSDQLSSQEKSSRGTIWGTKRSPREHLLCFFDALHFCASGFPGRRIGDVRFVSKNPAFKLGRATAFQQLGVCNLFMDVRHQ